MEHYIKLDIRKFLIKYQCFQMVKDYPWLVDLKLVCNPRLTVSYGRAWNERGKNLGTLELSGSLFMYHQGYIKEVFIHELVHFIAARHGDFGHGKIFKEKMFEYTGFKVTSRFHQHIFDQNCQLRKNLVL